MARIRLPGSRILSAVHDPADELEEDQPADPGQDLYEADLDETAPDEPDRPVARKAPARVATQRRAPSREMVRGADRRSEPDPASDPTAPFFVAGTALTILAALLLVFVADLLVVGQIRYARDQQTAFDDLRVAFANGTGVVNQLGDDGRPVPLGTALGVIEIPQIGVRQVFFEGTTSGVMMSGPGHERDTALPGQAGNSVIMGRKAGFGGPFNYLAQLGPNSILWVWTGQGKSAYRVIGMHRPGDPEPAPLAPGAGRLTLVTADGSDYAPLGTVRVDAALVQTRAESPDTAVRQPQPSGPRPITALDLPLDERPMSGESGAWGDVVLWALGLGLAALALTWARLRWGRWQTWLAGGPLVLALALSTSEQLARLLPNLL